MQCDCGRELEFWEIVRKCHVCNTRMCPECIAYAAKQQLGMGCFFLCDTCKSDDAVSYQTVAINNKISGDMVTGSFVQWVLYYKGNPEWRSPDINSIVLSIKKNSYNYTIGRMWVTKGLEVPPLLKTKRQISRLSDNRF